MNGICKTTLNGLLNLGYSNALAYLSRHNQQIARDFLKIQDLKRRDIDYLTSVLADPIGIEMVDFKLVVLTKTNELLKNAATASIINFFNTVQNEMIALYSIFILFLIASTILFFVVVFKRLRLIIMNINILLRVIPAMICFDKQTQRELSQFYLT